MSEPSRPRVDFANPPIVEVALSVQFDPLPSLHTAHLGLLWTRFRERFPKTEDYPPLPSATERFGARGHQRPGIEIKVLETAQIPRVWFLNSAETLLIQVQHDRISYNWRRSEGNDDSYPSYDQMRIDFESVLVTFRTFLVEEQLGELIPNQCEITYVDHIASGRGWERHGQIDEVFTAWVSPGGYKLPAEPEQVRFAVQYVIPSENAGEPLGRVYVEVDPASRLSDAKPMIVMNTTARGRPNGAGIDGILRFLDVGHDWVLRAFLAVTTETMHDIWRGT